MKQKYMIVQQPYEKITYCINLSHAYNACSPMIIVFICSQISLIIMTQSQYQMASDLRLAAWKGMNNLESLQVKLYIIYIYSLMLRSKIIQPRLCYHLYGPAHI